MKRIVAGLLLCCSILLIGEGCQERKRQVAPPEAPGVPISQPAQREVTDYVDFTGRTDAVDAVDIRPRVTGYLVKVAFTEGAEVKKGQLLFEVDPRPYQAQYDQAVAQVALYKAALELAKTTYERDRGIFAASAGAISRQQLDQDRAAVQEAEARVKAYESMTKIYKLNLDFCQVTSPINGRTSRAYLTEGNLVAQDQTLLTTVVSLEPMFAYFDMDEPTLLRIRRLINEGKIKRPKSGEAAIIDSAVWAWASPHFTVADCALALKVANSTITPGGEMRVMMGLQGEEGFPHKGVVNFFNNQVNPTTGSISVRGEFQNEEPKGGARLLSPGMFVRIRLPIGQPYQALLVIDRAIGSDQGIKYVYVLGKDNKVETRRVTTGALQSDGLRVITEGLKPDDWVIVGALPQIRARMEVRPQQLREMPTMTQGEANRVLPPPEPKNAPQRPKGKK
jgi:multidrug efflux system membrane fusion protein